MCFINSLLIIPLFLSLRGGHYATMETVTEDHLFFKYIIIENNWKNIMFVKAKQKQEGPGTLT